MRKLCTILLLLFATCAFTEAQLAPQPFLAPPTLRPAAKPSTGMLMMKAEKLTLGATAPTVCNPAAQVSHKGSVTQVDLEVVEAENDIYNPGAENNIYKDHVKLRSYGGCLTGPVLDLPPGTTLRVHLDNQLDKNDPTCIPGHPDPGCFNTINLHYHGLHVSPSGNSDNVLLNIAPGTSFDYEVNIPEDHPAGTFWYHAHRHGSTAVQVASGASGVLIIRGHRPFTGGDPGDVDTILKGTDGKAMPEKVFLFQQIPYACFAPGAPTVPLENADHTWMCPAGATGIVQDFGSQLDSATIWDTSGRFTSINGAVQPVIKDITVGEIQRWRMVHGGIHDTVNVQIVPMVTPKANGPLSAEVALALKGVFAGSPAVQEKVLEQVCPIHGPAGTSNLVPQFEVAADGLTRTALHPIGVDQKNISGGIGTNFLQPGYRSDVLVVFPAAGNYCVLNQAATPGERANNGDGHGGGQGPSKPELLATVIVSAGNAMKTDPLTYIEQALYARNKGDKQLPVAALNGLLKGDLTPWRGMPEPPPTSNFDKPLNVSFYIGNLNLPLPPTPQIVPAQPQGAFGFFVNGKEYDPNRIDFTRQVGQTEDWMVTSYGEPHIYHIHVNPFQVVDVQQQQKDGSYQSIFNADGSCKALADPLGLENQYCGLWHTFKDTVFVQNGYQVRLRTTYDRYIGEFVIHCHILDHEDSGMMTNVQIVPDLGAPGNGLGMAGMKHMEH